MRFYKLWIEIEEIDSLTGETKDLTAEGRALPVPLAVFPTLNAAVRFAETCAMDKEGLEAEPSPGSGEIH